jgi:hypothetical protein
MHGGQGIVSVGCLLYRVGLLESRGAKLLEEPMHFRCDGRHRRVGMV